MSTTSGSATSVGRVRDHNEDCFANDDTVGVYVVCDGMGGHAAGEVAAAMAVASVLATVGAAHHAGKPTEPVERMRILRLAISRACAEVFEAARESDRAGMGTTIVAVWADGPTAVVANVGDSRAYLLRDGDLVQLTSDHTISADLVRRGLLTTETEKTFRFRNYLSRTVGTQPAVEIDVRLLDLANEDRIVLCSDGLSHYLDESLDAAGRVEAGEPQTTADQLVAFAEEQGGVDNITVVVADVAGLEETRASDPTRTLEFLGECEVFAGLPSRDLLLVLAAGRLEHWKEGQVLVREGAPVSRIYIVVSGEVSGRAGGTEVDRFAAGRMTGGRTLMEPLLARLTLTAATDAEVLRFEGSALRRLFLRRPMLGVRVLGRLNRRLARSSGRHPAE
jgi:PPM family protein phosphatase